MLTSFCPPFRRPRASFRSHELHSRRWEAHPERLRRAFSRLPEDVREKLLQPAHFEHLVAGGVLRAALLAQGLAPAEADRLIVRRVRPQFVGVVLAFLADVLSSDERTQPVLPRELVYHEVVLPLPPSMDPRAQVEPDSAQLMPVAKAAKLPRDRQPREARDARRNNRVVRHCHSCGVYKQSVEFYACCLHDEQRVCRTCMLARPAEPFGEHLAEEYRTGRVLTLACASLTMLAEDILCIERNINRPAGVNGAPINATGDEGKVIGDAPGCTNEKSAAAPVPSTTSPAPSTWGKSDKIRVAGASAGVAEAPPFVAVTAATAATAAATTAKTATVLVRVAAFFGRFGWRSASIAVAGVAFLLTKYQVTVGATASVASALLLRWAVVFGAGGTLFMLVWLNLTIILPFGVVQLHRLFPATFERVAGDPNRWIFEVPDTFGGSRLAGTRDAIGRRARRAAKRSAAAAAAAAAAVAAEWSAEEEADEREAEFRERAARARQRPGGGNDATVNAQPGAGIEDDALSFFELTANTRAALGLIAAAFLPIATHFGARTTLVVAAWVMAAVLVPIGVARLHARLPMLFGMVAGDPQRWVFESSAKSMEKTLVETREAIGRRARRAAKRSAAAASAAAAAAAAEWSADDDEREWGDYDSGDEPPIIPWWERGHSNGLTHRHHATAHGGTAQSAPAAAAPPPEHSPPKCPRTATSNGEEEEGWQVCGSSFVPSSKAPTNATASNQTAEQQHHKPPPSIGELTDGRTEDEQLMWAMRESVQGMPDDVQAPESATLSPCDLNLRPPDASNSVARVPMARRGSDEPACSESCTPQNLSSNTVVVLEQQVQQLLGVVARLEEKLDQLGEKKLAAGPSPDLVAGKNLPPSHAPSVAAGDSCSEKPCALTADTAMDDGRPIDSSSTFDMETDESRSISSDHAPHRDFTCATATDSGEESESMA